MERWEILQSWCVKFMQNRDWKSSWWYRRESLQLWTKLLGPIFQVPCWKLHVHMKGWPCGWIAFFATFSGTWTRKKQVYLIVSHESFPPKYQKMFTVRHWANHAVKNQKKLHITDVRCGAAKFTPQVGIVQWPRYVLTVPPRKWWVISGAMLQPTRKWRRVVTRYPFLWCYFHEIPKICQNNILSNRPIYIYTIIATLTQAQIEPYVKLFTIFLIEILFFCICLGVAI